MCDVIFNVSWCLLRCQTGISGARNGPGIVQPQDFALELYRHLEAMQQSASSLGEQLGGHMSSGVVKSHLLLASSTLDSVVEVAASATASEAVSDEVSEGASPEASSRVALSSPLSLMLTLFFGASSTMVFVFGHPVSMRAPRVTACAA